MIGAIVLPDPQKARVDLYPVYAPDGILNIQDILILSRKLFAL